MKQVRPKKNLGQHFLCDLSIARRIADTVDEPYAELPVLEVGPGMGVMTQFLAEKLRIAIEKAQLIKQQTITCSFGIAEMIPGEDPKKLFERADKALYASKEGGRNRVTSATYKRQNR